MHRNAPKQFVLASMDNNLDAGAGAGELCESVDEKEDVLQRVSLRQPFSQPLSNKPGSTNLHAHTLREWKLSPMDSRGIDTVDTRPIRSTPGSGRFLVVERALKRKQ